MTKLYYLLFFAVGIGAFQVQAQELSTVTYAKLTHGVLKNGMSYYIMHNEEPKGKVSFYFAQNVGSILENEGQRGLAHFLEHMAFNGTDHFKGKAMLQFLEKNGVRFGTDINAFTLYDETVYNINNVPAQNEKVLDSVLHILQDWSGGLTLADEEIDGERGVVHEEWRTRYHPVKKAEDSVKNLGLLKGSKYAMRSPIGSMQVIDHFKYHELKDYYKKWYRPDMQAVIVVGDVNEKEMEQKIKTIFSAIPSPEHAAKRPVFEVPAGDALTYLTIKDKEITTAAIELYTKHILNKDQTIQEALKEEVLQQLISSVIDKRLSYLAERAQSPVYTARFSFTEIVRPLAASQTKLEPKKDSIAAAIKLALTEVRRFKAFGATVKEFNDGKASLSTSLQSDTGKSDYSNIYQAIALYKTFFKGRPLADERWEAAFKLSYLKTLTNADLIKYFTAYDHSGGKVLAITGSDQLAYPSKETVVKITEQVNHTPAAPFKQVTEARKSLMALKLSEGAIVKKQNIANNGIQYTLSNGANVRWYPYANDLSDKNVYFKAFSPGGLSCLPQQDIANGFYAPMVAQASGIANLNEKELRASGEVITPKVSIDQYQENLEGFAQAANLENLGRGIYLSFESPRFDQQALEKTIQDLERLNLALKGNVQSALTDSLLWAQSGYSDREMHLGKDVLSELSLDKIKSVYHDRITNASDFTFVFMGNIPESTFESMIKKYIGSIPGTHQEESFKDHQMRPQTGLHKVHITRAMNTPQTSVRISISGDLPDTHENEILLEVVEKLLAKRYLQRIREEEGGTYGVRVQHSLTSVPKDAFSLAISFNCNPEKAATLIAIVYEEFEKLSQTVNPSELTEAKTGLVAELERNEKSSRYIFEQLVKSVENNTPLWNSKYAVTFVQKITADQIMKLAKAIHKQPRIVEGVLAPAK